MTQNAQDLTANVLSKIQYLSSHDFLSSQAAVHPFSSSSEATINFLRVIIETTNQVSHSLQWRSSSPLTNPKLISLLRQHAAISHSVNLTDQTTHETLVTLRKRVGITYGADVPLDPATIVDWCLQRLESWASAVGMETFKEEERAGRMTTVLGGKVLVIDVDLTIDRSAPDHPRIDIANLTTSYAIPNGATSSNKEGSVSLEGFLKRSFRSFLAEVQKDPDSQDRLKVETLSKDLPAHLKYLMRLDQLALREGDSGQRWFTDLDHLLLELEKVVSSETDVVSRALSTRPAPLDIFLIRSHPLPLPYLVMPSMSFLIYLSPLAYLSILRTSPNIIPSGKNTPQLDIPIAHLRECLGSHPRLNGATIATLVLCPGSQLEQKQNPDDPMGMGLPVPLIPGARIDHTFPQVSGKTAVDTPEGYVWVLDFTDGGSSPGIVMSQSKMREIEHAVGAGVPFSDLDHAPMMSFGMKSWVDLLLNPENPISSERYTALYTSPTSLHPPLQLTLLAPTEPGFILEKVPVRNLTELWAVSEIVKEQCWLNETLNFCHWLPENLLTTGHFNDMGNESTTEELDAILKGTFTPQSIPVYVRLGQTSDADPASVPFTSLRRTPKIFMDSPECPPIAGVVHINVSYDLSRPAGVSVEVGGAMGAELHIEALEAVCRRGGLFGLPGRVWVKSRSIALA